MVIGFYTLFDIAFILFPFINEWSIFQSPYMPFQRSHRAKGSRVDNRNREPFPKAAESRSQKRREGEGTPGPPPE